MWVIFPIGVLFMRGLPISEAAADIIGKGIRSMWRSSRLFGRGCLDGKSDCDNLTIGEIVHL